MKKLADENEKKKSGIISLDVKYSYLLLLNVGTQTTS